MNVSRLIFLFLFVIQMNSSFAQDNNNIYLLGHSDDGSIYALDGDWIKDQFGSIYLKNYCLSRIPGKFASDTSRWKKCGDYTENGGVLEYEFINQKVIDPNDSTKFLKSSLNKSRDSIITYRNILQSIMVEIGESSGSGTLNLYGFDIELKSILSGDNRKPNDYVLNEAQNEITEYIYTPYLSLSSGQIEYTSSISTSFFEPGDLGIVHAFSKSFKIISNKNGSKDIVPVVVIGNQLWMSQNLAADKFSNNDVIPKYEDWNIWSSLSTSAYFLHEGNKYYNQAALIDNRNICPVGFHVPNEIDLVELVRTISPDQRDFIKLKKNNKLYLNQKSNDLKMNGLISKDVKMFNSRKSRSEDATTLPTNEYLMNLDLSNKILIGDQKGINLKLSAIFLPFVYSLSTSKKILSLSYSSERYQSYSNEQRLLPYSSPPSDNIIFFTSDISDKRDKYRYIPKIENKIGYAVRCVADK
jgi:uncharacterized protein (TIGR02145 family)